MKQERKKKEEEQERMTKKEKRKTRESRVSSPINTRFPASGKDVSLPLHKYYIHYFMRPLVASLSRAPSSFPSLLDYLRVFFVLHLALETFRRLFLVKQSSNSVPYSRQRLQTPPADLQNGETRNGNLSKRVILLLVFWE